MGNLPIAQNTPLFDKNRYSMVVGVTGHRTIDHPQKEIEEKLVKILEDKKPALVITGMALGFDLLVAELCFKQNIPYLAALPFRKQDALWNEESRKSYLFLLEKASEVVLVNDREYVSNSDYHKRDRWIVDNSHKMICYRKPKQQSGGTVYTCKYAGIKNVEIIANVYTK